MFILELNQELIDACGDPGLATMLQIVQNIMGIIQVIVPILLIIAAIWVFTRLMMNPEEKKLMKALRNCVFAAVIVFFLPYVVNLTMSWLDDSFNASACWKVAKEAKSSISWNDPGESSDHSSNKKLPGLQDYGFDSDNPGSGDTSSPANGEKLNGPDALIACGDYYNSKLESAVKKGEKWVYSNSSKYVKQSGTFEQMLNYKTGIRGGNCASIANWAYRDMGIMGKGDKFHCQSDGIHWGGNAEEKVKKNCKIINVKSTKKSFQTLVKEGVIKKGDVILGSGHTYVYRGDGTVFASGHDAKWHSDHSVKTEDSRKAVFETWVRKYKGTYDATFKPYYIVRIKDSFVPKYYRDSKGKLVKNR